MSETVDFTFGSKSRTFVAPCAGGPHDGKLARADWVLQSVIIMRHIGGFNFVYDSYRLVGGKEGERYWQFEKSCPK